MAKLMLIGEVAQVELTADPEDGQPIAVCVGHTPPGSTGWLGSACGWTERYDDLNDGAECAADHADRGTR